MKKVGGQGGVVRLSRLQLFHIAVWRKQGLLDDIFEFAQLFRHENHGFAEIFLAQILDMSIKIIFDQIELSKSFYKPHQRACSSNGSTSETNW